MKKFLLVATSFLLVGATQQVDARKKVVSQQTKTTRVQSWHPHHRMTQAERIERGEKAVAENTAVLAALGQTNLAKTNPAAYQRVSKALSRSETRLKDLKSGKRRSHMGYRAHGAAARGGHGMKAHKAHAGKRTRGYEKRSVTKRYFSSNCICKINENNRHN